jgi:hypothetical protein
MPIKLEPNRIEQRLNPYQYSKGDPYEVWNSDYTCNPAHGFRLYTVETCFRAGPDCNTNTI